MDADPASGAAAGAAPAGDKASAAEPLADLARAKVNLFLHVRGRRPDGRHTLESLAVFPQTGDVVSAERSPIRSLSLDGPFSMEIGTGEDNLVLRAVEALSAATGVRDGAALRLEKRLPVASGVGGGSADAAAALRLLMRLWGVAPDDAALARVALELGADVPVCLASAPSFMRGVGEELAPAPPFPAFWMVLANPMRQLSTADVFGGLERADNAPGPAAPAHFLSFGDLIAWLSRQRNDLEAPARRLVPAIGGVLGALRWLPSCRLARMSGSGATCFGLFETQAEALVAADRIRSGQPDWWTTPAEVAAWAGPSAAAGVESFA